MDKYLGKQFNLQSYHCWHHVQLISKEIFDTILPDYTFLGLDASSKYFKKARGYHELIKPSEGCIVRGVASKNRFHVGIFINGLVYHCRFPRSCAESLSMFESHYKDVRFFKYEG